MKNQKGITLIALVITIIVLLILAGVAIAMFSGENGILTKAKTSSIATSITNAKESIGLLVNENVTKFYNNKYAGGSDTGITGDTAADVINNTLKGLDGSTAYDGVEIKYTEAVAANPSASPAVEAQDATITISAKADSSKKTTGKINATTGAITWTDAYND